MIFETGENTYGYVVSETTDDVFLNNQQEFTITFFGARYPLEIDELYTAIKTFVQFRGCEIHIDRKDAKFHGKRQSNHRTNGT